MNEITVWFLTFFMHGIQPAHLSMHRDSEACNAALVQYAVKNMSCVRSTIVVPVTTEIVTLPVATEDAKVAGQVNEYKYVWDIKNPTPERAAACSEGCYFVTRKELLNSLNSANRVGRLAEKKKIPNSP